MAVTTKHKLVMIVIVLALFSGFTLYERILRQRNVFVLSEAPADSAASETRSVGSTVKDFENAAEITSPEKEISSIVVHVEGQVASPGVYELAHGSRVIDAVEMAGGLTPEADRKINLAQKLQDEAFIYVPAVDELRDEGALLQPTFSFHSGLAPSDQSLVNINTADAKKLETLPGIGPVLAERIIAYRQQQGPFRQLEDLKKVTGIGDKRFEDIQSSITI
ncbi:MAG: helix-hairpin-helix domain-containing protein [Bacillota bacterium]|nr:helix-hairpin-helix domain-containing protein [Bacillota bacterium]MDW7677695.1 helix-hairpin-helix domain-containing protein [Bacillota bacterium]